MSRKKKLTLKDKIRLSKDNICWKCKGNIEFDKEIKALKCDACGMIIDVKNKLKI